MPVDSEGKETGWIHKFAFQNSALSADTVGREAMEDQYLQNAKIADATITPTKVASGFFITGIYGVGLYDTAVYG